MLLVGAVRLGGNLGNAGCPVLPIEGIGLDVIQAPIPEPRIMRYELTDFEWAAIRSFLPNKPRGIPRVDDRRVLNGIFWVLRSGALWRDLPEVEAAKRCDFDECCRKNGSQVLIWIDLFIASSPAVVGILTCHSMPGDIALPRIYEMEMVVQGTLPNSDAASSYGLTMLFIPNSGSTKLKGDTPAYALTFAAAIWSSFDVLQIFHRERSQPY